MNCLEKARKHEAKNLVITLLVLALSIIFKIDKISKTHLIKEKLYQTNSLNETPGFLGKIIKKLNNLVGKIHQVLPSKTSPTQSLNIPIGYTKLVEKGSEPHNDNSSQHPNQFKKLEKKLSEKEIIPDYAGSRLKGFVLQWGPPNRPRYPDSHSLTVTPWPLSAWFVEWFRSYAITVPGFMVTMFDAPRLCSSIVSSKCSTSQGASGVPPTYITPSGSNFSSLRRNRGRTIQK